MLVNFRSSATETITMFKDVADSLLKLMGASGKIPGAFGPEDVPAALKRLETAIEDLKAKHHAPAAAPPADNEDAPSDDDDTRESPVGLAIRAVPLISMMKRAAAAGAEVVWEGK